MSVISKSRLLLRPGLLAVAFSAVSLAPMQFHDAAAQGAKPVLLVKNLLIRGLGGKCLSIRKASKNTGVNVLLTKCHGKAHQRWHFYADGRIKSAMKSRYSNGVKPCLSASHNNNVVMAGCGNGVDVSDRWVWKLKGQNIVSQRGVCLTAEGPPSKKKPNVYMAGCNSKPGQRWNMAWQFHKKIKPVKQAVIFKSSSGRCLGLADGAAKNSGRTKIMLTKCSGKADQAWTQYSNRTIRNAQNKHCLRIEDFGTKRVSEIYTEPCSQRTEALWVLKGDRILSAFDQRCLDHRHVKGLVRAMACNGSKNKWKITPAPKM
jgi:hypothetical protein